MHLALMMDEGEYDRYNRGVFERETASPEDIAFADTVKKASEACYVTGCMEGLKLCSLIEFPNPKNPVRPPPHQEPT